MVEAVKKHLAEFKLLNAAGLSPFVTWKKREKKNVYGQQKPSFKMRLWM